MQAAPQLRAGGCQGSSGPGARSGVGVRGDFARPVARVQDPAAADRRRVVTGRAEEHVGPAHGMGAPGAHAAHVGAREGPRDGIYRSRRGCEDHLRLRRRPRGRGGGQGCRGSRHGDGDQREDRRGGARRGAGGIRARLRGCLRGCLRRHARAPGTSHQSGGAAAGDPTEDPGPTRPDAEAPGGDEGTR